MKVLLEKMKSENIVWEIIFENSINQPTNDLCLEYRKKLSELKTKKQAPNQSTDKAGRDISQTEIYRWQMSP